MEDELRWLLQREVQPTLHQLLVDVDRCEKRLWQPANKFVLGGNDMKQCSLKAVLSLSGDEITEADISIESPYKQFYHCTVGEAGVYKLHQLINCSSTLTAAKFTIQQASESPHELHPLRTRDTLEKIYNLVRSARDHIVQPLRRSVDDLAQSKHRAVFKPPVPNDMSLSFYLSGQKIMLAVYFLHYSTKSRSYDISCRASVHAVVPWLNELLRDLSRAMFDVSMLMEKLDKMA